jgi:uncharacterized protein (DUF4213/DUF364 family)
VTVLEDLVANLDNDAPVHTILVGAQWTVVCSRHCGMAATLLEHRPHGSNAVREVGRLHKKTAHELVEYIFSDNLLEASIGMAAINSLLDVDEKQSIEVNAVDVLIDEGKGKQVALVGHFPFIPKLQPAVRRLWVIEQHPTEGEYPAEAASDLLPQSDVVAITSSALINHTLDGLLQFCRADALVMMLGPSTPLSPIIFQHGVSILSGSKIIDENALLRTVGQGATFQQVEGVRLLSIRKETYGC